jgi:hypothetical protein
MTMANAATASVIRNRLRFIKITSKNTRANGTINRELPGLILEVL